MEAKTTQIRIKPNCTVAEGSGGTPRRPNRTPIWVTPSRARLLIDGGAAELVNVGPAESKPAGPSENKATATPGDTGPKSSPAAQAGQSTDSAQSSLLGQAGSLLASVADQVFPSRRSKRQAKQAAGSSQ